jgi:biopolymer transport protein ExbD
MSTTPDELYLAKRKARKAARRNRPEEKGDLTITSLMDVVSIIVVYLLKTYGSDPVVIMPTAGQKIPMSAADAPIQDGVPVYISKRSITFANQTIVQLDDAGEIDPAAMQGHLIGPLYDLMAEEADKAKQMAAAQGSEWSGVVILVGDQNLKFSTIVNVMYTAGRAEYREYAFCVIQQNA